MAATAAPIDIAASNSHPARNQTSNLTSALQDANNGDSFASGFNGFASSLTKAAFGRHDSMSLSGSQWRSGTQPINVNGPGRSNTERTRRESMAGSLVAAMSFGGLSVGSFIRDDIIMTGSSPFTQQTPSFHSSSYLPKLEKQFMTDFTCCGLRLNDLHDLLQHYETAHAQKLPQIRQPEQESLPDVKAALASGAAKKVQAQAQQDVHRQNSNFGTPQDPSTLFGSRTPSIQQSQMQIDTTPGPRRSDEMDAIEDIEMEMDDVTTDNDATPPPNLYQASQSMEPNRSQFSRASAPPLNLGGLHMMQSPTGMRHSQPTTPVAGRQGQLFPNNPTVSSVNTPTLMTHSLQVQQSHGTPDSSTPGTPAELDQDTFGTAEMSSSQYQMLVGGMGFGFGINNMGNAQYDSSMLDYCIDEPAKRLLTENSGMGNQTQQVIHGKLGTSAHYSADSEIARNIRARQLLAGLPDTTVGQMPGDEPKPFRCPVVGCEKAYKNQNGLKYHKQHGHNNQQLHDNSDGTYSIVDPLTSMPYPGTLGMEKEKPYKCTHCGKRYKNLNGLKYHKGHSPPCNPELPLNAMNSGMAQVLQRANANVNVAGAGLTSLGDTIL